jgi:hypothetical protein
LQNMLRADGEDPEGRIEWVGRSEPARSSLPEQWPMGFHGYGRLTGPTFFSTSFVSVTFVWYGELAIEGNRTAVTAKADVGP